METPTKKSWFPVPPFDEVDSGLVTGCASLFFALVESNMNAFTPLALLAHGCALAVFSKGRQYDAETDAKLVFQTFAASTALGLAALFFWCASLSATVRFSQFISLALLVAYVGYAGKIANAKYAVYKNPPIPGLP